MNKCPHFVDGPNYCYSMKSSMFGLTRKERERKMIQQMEYVDGFEFVSRDDFKTMSRDELQAYLEARGFAVYDNETREDLERAAEDDFLTEYFC